MILDKVAIEEIAVACAKFKNEVVEKDFKEEGERIHLNLGHTLGHAFEFNLKIPHGQAVAMGLKYLFKVMKMDDALAQWEKMVKALDLPSEKFEIHSFPQFDFRAFSSYLDQDKKKVDAKLRLVLVKGIGLCYVQEVPLKDFKAKIQSYEGFKG